MTDVMIVAEFPLPSEGGAWGGAEELGGRGGREEGEEDERERTSSSSTGC